MLNSSNSTFIHELKLSTSPKQLNVLDSRLNIARQIYNACLGESLKRLYLMRCSKVYQKALRLPKTLSNKNDKVVVNKQKNILFRQVRDKYAFNEYAIHKYLTRIYSKTWLTQHIDSLTAQKIASRAFSAVEQYAYKKRGKPRFKGKYRFSSLEGKNNKSGLRFIDGKVVWSVKNSDKLILSPIYDKKDKHGLEANVLNSKTKYIRLIKRVIKGCPVWYVQLIQSGIPYIKAKHQPCNDVIGLDIGPSTIAVVSKTDAKLQAFCPDLQDSLQEIARLQKKLSRSLRITNKDNFAADKFVKNSNGNYVKKQGKIKQGPKFWFNSTRYKNLRIKIQEKQRKMVAGRKCAHGSLINSLLSQGNIINTEKLSYKNWQKLFGKSINFRAPGLFLEKLRHKAASAGGKVIEFNPRNTALSQMCHCGNKQKKSLSERWHNCKVCGVKAQRDLYSAFLAMHVADNRLDTSQAKKAWPGAGILLERAVSNLNKTVSGKTCLASFGLGQRQNSSSAKEESMQNEALDAVACS